MPDSNSTTDLQKCTFSLQLPRKPSVGDEIVVKGVLCDDAKMFSVNFADTSMISEVSALIVYHFGVHLCDGEIFQCSRNDTWEEHHRSNWTWHEENSRNFTLIFRFGHDVIKVFFDHTQNTPDFEFEHQYPIERIQHVELWEDIERVEEITLRYGKPSEED